MTVIKRDAVVAYSAQQMFDLVNHIEDYPHFIPWCKSTQLISRNTDEIRARLYFARGGMEKSFTTCNRLQTNKLIEIRLLDGPFRQLEGFWSFETLPEGCLVSLNLEFEFSSKIIGMMFSPVFHPIASRLVDVFSQRAQVVYGMPG